jgi:elongation factor Ts
VDGELADAVKDVVTAKIAEIGENIVARRSVRYSLQGAGVVASYIHLGAKVGALIEVGCEKDATARDPRFQEVAKDILLHIAASIPRYLSRADVPADVLTAEREIYAKQVQGKPPAIVEKIVDGKMGKFYQQTCLVDQGFVKDPEQSVAKVIEAKGKEMGDKLSIRRFVRYQLGE